MEAKDIRNRAAAQIMRLAIHKFVVEYSDSVAIQKATENIKSRTVVLPTHKNSNKINNINREGIQSYIFMCKKVIIPEHKYSSNSAETCFDKRSDQESLKKGLERNLVKRDPDAK